jgi:hypothetical protein
VGDEVDLIASPTPDEARLFENAGPEKIPSNNLQTLVAAADGNAEGLR